MVLADATPCPGAHYSSPFVTIPRHRASRFSFAGEDDTIATQDVEFTTDFRAAFRNAAPRRGRLGPARRPATFDICEDAEAEDPKKGTNSPLRKAGRAIKESRVQSSMLRQPAQRLRPGSTASFKPGVPSYSQETEVPRPPIPAPGERTTIKAQSHSVRESPRQNDPPGNDLFGHRPFHPQNDRRRRDPVYIPSEDTTIPNIYLNIFSPIKSEAQLQAEKEALDQIEFQAAKRKAPRQSLAAAPKRVPRPLQPSLKPIQENVVNLNQDVWSGKKGKENIPPGLQTSLELCGKSKKIRKSYSPKLDAAPVLKPQGSLKLNSSPAAPNKAHAVSRPPNARLNIESRHINSRTVLSTNNNAMKNGNSTYPTPRKSRTISRPQEPRPVEQEPPKSIVACKDRNILPKLRSLPTPRLTISIRYPLIDHDVEFSHMYEDEWLSHQENAFTQLINSIFSFAATGRKLQPLDQNSLQQNMLSLYYTPIFSELHQRIKASIVHGALALPKDSLDKVNLSRDVGLKRKFLDLWMETYDLDILRTAAEVIIGRKCCASGDLTTSVGGNKIGKRAIEEFLSTFFIRNEDKIGDEVNMNGSFVEPETGNWRHSHTALRSFMLILLLDQWKEAADMSSGCLFRETSQYKSSIEVVRAFKEILLPSLGDIYRPLSHLGYEVKHAQCPLDEYEYKIENLATDLRDGVCLTRLVELLLLSSSEWQDLPKSFTLSTGVVLAFDSDADKPFSKHLKCPAVSRATQLFNVQVALDALSQISNDIELVQDVRAEDIVNGHREKTLALLWRLLGVYGLRSLVDWEDMHGEIKRLTKGGQNANNVNHNKTEDDAEHFAGILREWARAIGARKGIAINNLTTDFAGGTGNRAFEAIVDEYEQYLPAHRTDIDGDGSTPELKDRLQGLGCSAPFAQIFGSKNRNGLGECSYLFNRKTTIAALGFLASRLLPVTRRARAATTIQRAWRCSRNRQVRGPEG